MEKSILHPLKCPQCGDTDNLFTVERVEGVCPIIIDGPDWEFSGYTEMLWDSTQSTTLCCGECDWRVALCKGDAKEITSLLRGGE